MLNTQVQPDGPYYQELRHPMLSLIRGNPKRILEIGCASGQTLAYLHSVGAELTVGIEYSPQAAERARNRQGVTRVLVGDVERMYLDLEPASFDLLIAGHVLEHLADPWKALRRLRTFLKPSGQLVAGLPNIRNQSVLFPLLLRGTWKYEPSGIMDWTHLRFFSRQTIQHLFASTGFHVERIVPEFGRKSRLASTATLHLFQDLLCFAFNVSATRSENGSGNHA
jgi:SAM-dependent methyltransferase